MSGKKPPTSVHVAVSAGGVRGSRADGTSLVLALELLLKVLVAIALAVTDVNKDADDGEDEDDGSDDDDGDEHGAEDGTLPRAWSGLGRDKTRGSKVVNRRIEEENEGG